MKEITRPNEGYVDGIKTFYQEHQIPRLLGEALAKEFSPEDPLEGRAYIVMKEMPDAKIGTVLRPALDYKIGKPTVKKNGKNMYCYGSKYAGRQHFLHSEIIEREVDWFRRIN